MTSEQVDAYDYAASLSAANEPDRAAWSAAVIALKRAEQKAIEDFKGELKLNSRGQPFGGVHPALASLSGYHNLNGCYEPDSRIDDIPK